MLLVRRRGEADEVVHDDVDRAAHGVSPQVGEIERFRPDALAGESGVAMHHDGDDLVRSFPRTVKVGAAQPDRKSTRLNSSHGYISYAVFCLKKKNTTTSN